MRGVRKFLLAFVAAALLSAGLAACGGGDSTTDSTAASTASTAKTAPPATTAKTARSAKSGKSGTQGSKGSSESAANPPPSDSPAAENEKGAASFDGPGRDDSIQTFGEEAESDEIAAVEEVLSSYLDARAKGEWAKSCSYMSPAFVKYLEKTFGRAPQFKKLNCTVLVTAIGSSISTADRKNTLTNGIGSLRVGAGGRGFVLYHAAGGVDYTMLTLKEGGVWKVAALAPTELPSSPAG